MKRLVTTLFVLCTAAIISLPFAGCKKEAEQPAKTEQPSNKVELPTGMEQPSSEHPSKPEVPAGAEQPSSEHPQ